LFEQLDISGNHRIALLAEKETVLSDVKYLATVAFNVLNPVTGLSR
jgi:hypothetical protein